MKAQTKNLRSLIDFQEELQKKAADINASIAELASAAKDLRKRVEEHAIKYTHTEHDVVVMRKEGKDVIVQLRNMADVIYAFGEIVTPVIIDTSTEVRSL